MKGKTYESQQMPLKKAEQQENLLQGPVETRWKTKIKTIHSLRL